MDNILEVAKQEIEKSLAEEKLRAPQFARVVRIARMAEEIVCADGRTDLVRVKNKILEETEFFAPVLHNAILEDLLGGDNIIKDKYKRLHRAHAQAEQVRQITEIARDKLTIERTKLQTEREEVHAERKLIRRMKDTLDMMKGSAELPPEAQVEIPSLPELPPPPGQEGEEKEDLTEDNDE